MMCCRRFQILIQLYADDAVSPEQRQVVDSHVAECPACARELSETQRLQNVLASVPARMLGADFDAKVLAAIRTRPVRSGLAMWWERFQLRTAWRLRTPALVAGTGLAMAGLLAVLQPSLGPGTRNTETGELVTSAVARHRELAPRATDSGWDAVDVSIDLNTGSVISE